MGGALTLLPLYAFMAWTGQLCLVFTFTTVYAFCFFSKAFYAYGTAWGRNQTTFSHTSTCSPVPRVFSRCNNITYSQLFLLLRSARHIIQKRTQMFKIFHPSVEHTSFVRNP